MSLPSLAASSGSRRALAVALIGVAVVAVALRIWWPAGVAIGLALGVVMVLGMGQQQQRAARAVPIDDTLIPGLEPRPAEAARALRRPVAVQRAQEVRTARPAAAPAPAPVERAAMIAAVAAAPVRSEAAASVRPAPTTAAPAPADDGVRADLDRLKADLGDDYPDFARAAQLVVSTQYASAARLQRDLQLPYSRARRLLADLETEHFVGPATGTLPRQVLLPKDKLPEVERLFAGA